MWTTGKGRTELWSKSNLRCFRYCREFLIRKQLVMLQKSCNGQFTRLERPYHIRHPPIRRSRSNTCTPNNSDKNRHTAVIARWWNAVRVLLAILLVYPHSEEKLFWVECFERQYCRTFVSYCWLSCYTAVLCTSPTTHRVGPYKASEGRPCSPSRGFESVPPVDDGCRIT